MFVIANLVRAVAGLLDFLLQGLLLIVLVNALLSWVRPDPYNPVVRALDRISNFVCGPIRRLIPTQVTGIDFAPLLAMLALWFLRSFLVTTLHDLANRIG